MKTDSRNSYGPRPSCSGDTAFAWIGASMNIQFEIIYSGSWLCTADIEISRVQTPYTLCTHIYNVLISIRYYSLPADPMSLTLFSSLFLSVFQYVLIEVALPNLQWSDVYGANGATSQGTRTRRLFHMLPPDTMLI